MNSDDLTLRCVDREMNVEEGLMQEYRKYYSSLKDENLRLMMKEILLLGVTQMKVANEIIRYVQEQKNPTTIDAFGPLAKDGQEKPAVEPYTPPISLPREIEDFGPTDSLIVELSPWDYGAFVMGSMRHLVSDLGYSCIYVSVTKPLVVMKEMMAMMGIDESKMSFIECSSAPGVGDSISPVSLEELNYRMDSLVESMGGRKIVVIDTISALRVYNSEPVILDYVNIVSKRAKVRGFGLIILDLPSGSDAINPVMSTFVDKVVKA